MAVVAVDGGDERARAREGESREGRRGRERVRGRSEGAAWRHPKRPGRSGKQEVAGACARASGARPPAYWQEVEDGGGCGGLGRTVLDQHRSWAGSGGLALVGCTAKHFSLSLAHLFLFFYFCYYVLI